MKNESMRFLPRTPLEAEVVRLAARGRCLSVENFIRIAVLRAACKTEGVFDLPADSDVTVESACTTLGSAAERLASAAAGSTAPGEAAQFVARVFWKSDWDFQRRPQRDEALWFKATEKEQSALRQLKIAAGEIVHGQRKDSSVSLQMVDWLREQAWMTPSNRVARNARDSLTCGIGPGRCRRPVAGDRRLGGTHRAQGEEPQRLPRPGCVQGCRTRAGRGRALELVLLGVRAC